MAGGQYSLPARRHPEDMFRSAGIGVETMRDSVLLTYKSIRRQISREEFEHMMYDEKHIAYAIRAIRDEYEMMAQASMARMTPPLEYVQAAKKSPLMYPLPAMEGLLPTPAPTPKASVNLLLLLEEEP